MLAKLIVEALLDSPTKWEPPALPEPTQEQEFDETPFRTADLAADYVEGEIGRHDWMHNWQQHKGRAGNELRERVAAWLRHYEVDHDPDSIVKYIEDELMQRPGKWL